jgi:transglutaminase-like putative cysteine protease
MASVAKSSSTPRWVRRIVNGWQSFFLPGDLTTLIIAVVLLLMPALSLGAAGWPLGMNTLSLVLILSVVFGFVLARSQYNELLGLMLSAIYGVCFVLLIAAINQPGGLDDGVYELFSRMFLWMRDAVTGGINQDDLVLTLLISGLFWFLGYNLAWHLFRVDRVWRAVLPPALILVTNSVYYTGDTNLDSYLVIFVFFTLLLVVRSNLDAREWDWYLNGVRVPRKLRRQVFRVGAMLALLVMIGAWLVPQHDIQERLNRFQEFLQSEPLTQLSELWNRLFASIETQGPTTADYYGGDSLELGGAIRLGDQVVFLASAPNNRRYYWRSRVFDNYDGGRWSSAAGIRLTDPEAPLDIAQDTFSTAARVPVQQQFTMGLSASRLIYTAPQPLRVDLPTRSDLSYATDQSMIISVIRPMRVLYEGEDYTATSMMSNATADQLRRAGTDYPQWVRDTYSPYFPSVSGRTIQLGQQIVAEAGATTRYDQAKAVETWLRANIAYNEVIAQPPDGIDPVDWVLFDIREGYCNYYASAMVVMLRSMGIPARMAAGFAQGTWDEAERAFVVRERDAHTWVEVYFPGYGWIEFEPTSAQAPLNRGDQIAVPEGQPPTNTPLPSPTPTDTPIPSPTPTQPAGSEATPEVESQQLPPTVTPTLTPSPTATPVIVPTQPPPLRPQPRDPLSFLLPAIGLGLLIVLLVVVVLVLITFIYWYWEWRGMGGLSPVMRAYARLERYIGLIGIRVSPQQTPEERRKHIVEELPAAEPPITAITNLYSAERYGRKSSADDSRYAKTADKAWTVTRGNILQRFLRRILMPWQK